MMNRYVILGLTVAALLFCSGCTFLVPYSTPVKPPPGGIFTNHKAPLMINLKDTDIGTDTIKYSHKKTYYFHDLILTQIDVAWGTADIPEIARRGGIKRVTHADYEMMNILGIYAEFTIHVYGYEDEKEL